MPFFTKKPVRIEAVQFLRVMPASGNPFFAGDDAEDATWPTWLVDALCKQSWQEGAMWVNAVGLDSNDFPTLHIRTLEGIMAVNPNDWVICGIKGELYPCKPDIFAATYDEAGEGAGWRPIASCPEDGFFLVYEDGTVRTMLRHKGAWESPDIPILIDKVGNRVVSKELEANRGERLELSGRIWEPTHWMPLSVEEPV